MTRLNVPLIEEIEEESGRFQDISQNVMKKKRMNLCHFDHFLWIRKILYRLLVEHLYDDEPALKLQYQMMTIWQKPSYRFVTAG